VDVVTPRFDVEMLDYGGNAAVLISSCNNNEEQP